MKGSNRFFWALLFILAVLGCSRKKPLPHGSGQGVIRYSAPGFMLYNTIRESVGREFEKQNPGVKTVYEPISGQGFFEKLLTQLAGGTEPDVFFMRDYEMPDFVRKGTLLELNSFISRDGEFNLKDYHKVLIDSYSMKGKIYGLPGSFTSGVLFYNKDLLSRAGLKPMRDLSWPRLLEVGKKLTLRDDSNSGAVRQFGIVMEYNDWITFILQNNGKVFSADRKKCVIHSPQAVEAIVFLKGLIKKERVTPGMADLEQGEPYSLFMLDRAALFTGGRWYTTIFKDIKKFKWGIMPFFYNKRKMVRLDSHSWVISRNAKNPELAWKFLKFLTSRDSNWKMVEVGDSVPVHKSNVEKFIKLDPENRVFVDSLSFAYTVDMIMTPYLTWREMQTIFNREFDRFLLDQQDARQTLISIEKEINRAIAKGQKSAEEQAQ